SEPSTLYRINTATNTLDKEYEFGASLMAFYQNKAYLISSNYRAGEDVLLEMDLNDGSLQESDVFEGEALDHIYGIAIDAENGDIWLSDANYGALGKIRRYNRAMDKVDLTYTAGAFPKVFTFKR